MKPSGVPDGFGIIGQPHVGQALFGASIVPGNAADVHVVVTAEGGFAAVRVV